MNKLTRLQMLMIVTYVMVGACAIAYLAGILYFVLNKAAPFDVAINTWWTCWQLYASDKRQHGLLLASGLMATVIVYGAPPAAWYMLRQKRSLHGDARWATESEIRKAGLL